MGMLFSAVKNVVKSIVISIIKKLPPKKIIVFESCPDLSDNTKAVFDELVRRGCNKKYKLVWMCYEPIRAEYPKIKNVKYVNAQSRLAFYRYVLSGKCIICCNRLYEADRQDQTFFYLTHGFPLKDTRSYYVCPSYVTYMLSPSVHAVDIMAKNFNVSKEKCVPLGFPRNDVLVTARRDLSGVFGHFDQYIVWYPTVKQFADGKTAGSAKPIPFLDSRENAEILNEAAKSRNALIIIKPHFAQVKSSIRQFEFSNLRFIDDRFFLDHGISSYELIGSCDALLTDYSSVCFDYVLTNKPIGFIWEDIEDYKKDPGLVDEYEYLCKCGRKIYTFEQLNDFVLHFEDDIPLFEKERAEIAQYTNFTDGKSAERVSDFIESCLESR